MTTPLEFLEAAHRYAEQVANATTPVPVAGSWSAVRDKHAASDGPLSLVQGSDPHEPGYQDYSGTPVIALAAEWEDEAEANLRHIALHDPRSVLRRIAAERTILAMWEDSEAVRHLPDGAHDGRDPDEVEAQVAWAQAIDDAVRALAEGWGWTEGTT